MGDPTYVLSGSITLNVKYPQCLVFPKVEFISHRLLLRFVWSGKRCLFLICSHWRPIHLSLDLYSRGLSPSSGRWHVSSEAGSSHLLSAPNICFLLPPTPPLHNGPILCERNTVVSLIQTNKFTKLWFVSVRIKGSWIYPAGRNSIENESVRRLDGTFQMIDVCADPRDAARCRSGRWLRRQNDCSGVIFVLWWGAICYCVKACKHSAHASLTQWDILVLSIAELAGWGGGWGARPAPKVRVLTYLGGRGDSILINAVALLQLNKTLINQYVAVIDRPQPLFSSSQGHVKGR